ncbi:MAG: hypothetical protein GC136_02730 [Alphaproteobacteria bacterium]|nr:hypothetical protein [Alphaproteobacteria bacterium]
MSKDYTRIMQDLAAAVAQGAEIAAADFESNMLAGSVAVESKGTKDNLPDYVTNTDVRIQQVIEAALQASYGDVPFIGEEGVQRNAAECAEFFLVDPLDGTSNFVALRDYFAVCAAYVENGVVKAAAVADPMRGTVAMAAEGKGAFLITKSVTYPLKNIADTEAPLAQMQFECEIPVKGADDKITIAGMRKDVTMAGTSTGPLSLKPDKIISPIMQRVSGFRKSGSSALDLMNLAMGRKICVVATSLKPHDIAAALLIAREAGAIVTDMKGAPANYDTDAIIAAPPKASKELVQLVAPAFPENVWPPSSCAP